MKKLILSAALVVGFGAYVYFGSGRTGASQVATLSPVANLNSPAPSVPAAPVVPPEPAPTPQPSTPTPPAPVPPATPAPQPRGRYKDGTYVGDAVDAFYGLVQVRAVVTGGKLTDVQFLQYPNDREHSQEISSYSLPTLRQEAIATQTAQVDIVSGATQTSEGFQQSLGSALAQAS